MNIKIDEKFEVTSDNTSFSLMFTPDKKEGSEKDPAPRAIGHYGDLAGALTGYVKNKMRNEDLDVGVNDVIEYLKEVEITIKSVLENQGK